MKHIKNSLLLKKQMDKLLDGIEEVIPKEDFEKILHKSIETSKPLIVKLGIDPTNPGLHLGHALVLKKLKDFQSFGHQIILLIGDATALIGDPSGRSKIRPVLSEEDIKQNMLHYCQQIESIIHFDEHVSIRYNSEWLFKLNFQNLMALASKYTLARILERDDFKKRYQQNHPISLSEIYYPLIQAYDSYFLKADIEIGGTDQRFNLLWGREIQKDFGQKSQIAITIPILEGTDGTLKMSKSLNNHIALMDSPKNFFGKLMSIPDALIFRYMDLLSSYSKEKIKKLSEDYTALKIHPKKIKEELAYDISLQYHGKESSQKAWQDFISVFSKNEMPNEKIIFPINTQSNSYKDFLELIISISYFQITSRTQARKALENGAFYLNSKKIIKDKLNIHSNINLMHGDILQFGKRIFIELQFSNLKDSLLLKL